MGQAKRFLERQWEEEMGVSGLSWTAITAVLGALVKEFKTDASIDEVRDAIADREGRVAGVSWSDVRQLLNNLAEVYSDECSDLGELCVIARPSTDGAHASLAAEVEDHRDMEELGERISRDD